MPISAKVSIGYHGFWGLFKDINLFSDTKKANDLTSFASLVQGYNYPVTGNRCKLLFLFTNIFGT